VYSLAPSLLKCTLFILTSENRYKQNSSNSKLQRLGGGGFCSVQKRRFTIILFIFSIPTYICILFRRFVLAKASAADECGAKKKIKLKGNKLLMFVQRIRYLPTKTHHTIRARHPRAIYGLAAGGGREGGDDTR